MSKRNDPRGTLNIRLRNQVMEQQQRNLIFELMDENDKLKSQIAELIARIDEKDKLSERLWSELAAARLRSVS